jgi:death-on-curing protein
MPTSGRNWPNIKHLSPQIIVEINRELIERFGGAYAAQVDNLQNPGSLYYILEAIATSMGSRDLYPSIFEKAAALGHSIIQKHVFFDGNKRTAFEVVRLFLSENRYDLPLDDEAIEKALAISEGELGLGEFANWLENKAIPMPPEWPEESLSGDS